MTPRSAALITCLCLPQLAMKCIHDASDQRLVRHTVTLAGTEEAIDVHGEIAGPVDDVSLFFDVTTAITDELTDTITIELIDVDNVQTRPIVDGEGGSNGTLPGCVEGACSFDMQLRFVRARPDDDAVVLELSSTLSAFKADAGPRPLIEAFSLTADDTVLLAHD